MTLLALPPEVAALGAALGCGLLIGIERERRKGTGPGRALAGVRSFALACVAGAACMLLGGLWLSLVGAAFIAALGVVAYARDRSGDPGVTTEIALLLTFVIGALCTTDLALAAALAVVVTVLLAAREHMHRFANQWLRQGEARDGLLLGALALIAVPLLPDHAYWGPVLNPRTLATLLALLLAIQTLAHLAQRLLSYPHPVIAACSTIDDLPTPGAPVSRTGMRASMYLPTRLAACCGRIDAVAMEAPSKS